MELLSRLNKIAIATGQSPDALLLRLIETIERKLVGEPISNADTVTPRKRKPNRGWSPASKAAHSIRMKEIYRKKKEAEEKQKTRYVMTPEHKAKLLAGRARYNIHRKLEALNG